MRPLYAILCSVLAIGANADLSDNWEWVKEKSNVLQDQSFGQGDAIWSEDHNHVTGWRLSGENEYSPDILSDRIILTPPHPGNRRAAMWAEHPQQEEIWSAEFEFRATGPERGSGNLQIWYAKEGHNEVGLASIYTVGKFDGLAITISRYGGRGGSIRGFLNDGTTSMKDHHDVDRLAFGHCDFSYRNLGRFTHIAMKQTPTSFEVTVDHRLCFETSKVKLPSGYYFGITAASAENPDSFESKGFIVSSKTQQQGSGSQHDDNPPETSPNNRGWYWVAEKDQVKDSPASSYKTEESRFQDLHDRITVLGRQLNVLFQDLTTFKTEQEQRHEELIRLLSPISDHAESTRRMMEQVERLVQDVKNDVESKDYRAHLDQLHRIVKEGHTTITNSITGSSPRFGFFVFLVVASQIALLAGYIVYRRRKDKLPKKYV